MAALILATTFVATAGCTSLRDYVRNGFKVGPNYCPPEATTAGHWIDDADVRVRKDSEVPGQWWSVFGDETLNGLIECAASQNLSLREASFRILEARAELGIAKGTLFPQSQNITGAYNRVVANGASIGVFNFPATFFEQWNFAFNLGWEIDFWGRIRRAITSAESALDASVDHYHDVLVTLLGDVAATYVQIRTAQRRIQLVRANVELQRGILNIAQRRFEAGARNELDVAQASSTLDQTQSQVPQLQAVLRDACNRMCVLLAVPPLDLEKRLGESPIPTAPPDAVVGIPADLLRRRPDVRRAERIAAAQAERIGIAEAALYPIIGLRGTLGWEARDLPHLFTSSALSGHIGPGMQWNILHYGRIRNNVRAQEAQFEQFVAAYQNTVLRANAEVESAMARFLRAQEVARLLDRSVANAQKAADIVAKQYKEGDVDFNRIALIEQTLVEQQDLQTRAHGEIALGLIQVYRAVGGGWEIPIGARAFDDIAAVSPSEPEMIEEEPLTASRRN